MIASKVLAGERDFRWRGAAVSRMEGLSDAVYALAMTTVVVSLPPPHTWSELHSTLRQAPAVAIGCALLAWLWMLQVRFQRRFGLQDRTTSWLNFGLLFLVLLYAYPLRFLIGHFYDVLLLGRGATTDSPRAIAPLFQSAEESRQWMLIYGGGFTAIFALFAALYARAWRLRADLELDSVERVLTKSAMHAHLLSVGVGAASMAIASSSAEWSALSRWLYCALGPLHIAHGWLTRRAVDRYRGKVPGAPKLV